MRRRNTVLGIAVEAQRLLIAEVMTDRSQVRVRRTAEWEFPAGMSFEDPEDLGEALGLFLRRERIGCRNAVVGLPASWLLVRRMDCPVTDAANLAGMIQIQMERELSIDYRELALDYLDQSTDESSKSLLLIGTLKKRLNQVTALLARADLRILAVLPSALALARETGAGHGIIRSVLYLRPAYAEIVAGNGKDIQSLQYIPQRSDLTEADEFSWEVILQSVHREFTAGGVEKNAKYSLDLWDGSGLDSQRIEELSKSLSDSYDLARGRLDVECQNGDLDERFAPAVRLGQSHCLPADLGLNLLDSRVAPASRKKLGKPLVWAVSVVMALLLVAGSFVWEWNQNKQDITVLTAQLESMKGEISEAEKLVNRVSTARHWYSARPRVLDCLREMTLAFPAQGTIWVSSLTLREDMRGIITGSATQETAVLGVLDRLKVNGVFANVKLIYMRSVNQRSQEVTFAIDFVYVNGG